MKGMLDIVEDAQFYFDEEAAGRPVRFIEKFLKHYEGRFAGNPFLLAPPQKKIITDLYGWKWKEGPLKGCRRFSDCYFEGAIGAGKSPLLAGLGLYGLMAEGEPGSQVYSLASNFGQARVVFDTAKQFIKSSPELAARLVSLQFEIRHEPSASFWRIVSKNGPGAGCKPWLILGDEAHQWPSAGGYKDLHDRMAKRPGALMIVATNAGESQVSFCWQLREKAVAALEGKPEYQTLYPVIWAADEAAKADDAAAWRDANPLMGITITEQKIRQKFEAAQAGDDIDRSEFLRLYLSRWPKVSAGRWIDLGKWDACTPKTFEEQPEKSPLYVGMDLSEGDDLCAVSYIWPGRERFYARFRYWMCRDVAEKYEKQHAVAYSEWAKAGYITLLDELTVSSAVRRLIAAEILAQRARFALKALCYDPARADEVVAIVQAAGVPCIRLQQGYTVSPGCNELANRLKEGSIAIEHNPVTRFCAENAVAVTDRRGNVILEKPMANGKYAGTRWRKVDAITAAVTGLTEARKFVFPTENKVQAWVY